MSCHGPAKRYHALNIPLISLASQGTITELEVDAIVNAAKNSLLGMGPQCYAIDDRADRASYRREWWSVVDVVYLDDLNPEPSHPVDGAIHKEAGRQLLEECASVRSGIHSRSR